jgi:hypothetical protein
MIKHCLNCSHLLGRKIVNGNLARGCKAFPKGIPAAILFGPLAHDPPLKGDRGFQWKQLTEAQARGRLAALGIKRFN